jgi:hypothetical protein
MKDTLFLLASGFYDGPGAPYYCPYCIGFEGLLHVYAEQLSAVEVHRVAFERPRQEIIALLGEAHQSCPVLVLGEAPKEPIENVRIKRVGERYFIDEPADIGNYLSYRYGIPRPH